jgi:hypothetical protein
MTVLRRLTNGGIMLGQIFMHECGQIYETIQTGRFWFHLLALLFLMTLCFITAIFSYSVFYSWYIPKIYHRFPVYFQYPSPSSVYHSTPLSASIPLLEEIDTTGNMLGEHELSHPFDSCDAHVHLLLRQQPIFIYFVFFCSCSFHISPMILHWTSRCRNPL